MKRLVDYFRSEYGIDEEESDDIRHLEMQVKILTRLAMLGWGLWGISVILAISKTK